MKLNERRALEEEPQERVTGYSWCYWPDGSASLAIIGEDGYVDRASIAANVKRDPSGAWIWEACGTPFHHGRFGIEPTREWAIENATIEALKAVPLPPWHRVMYPAPPEALS